MHEVARQRGINSRQTGILLLAALLHAALLLLPLRRATLPAPPPDAIQVSLLPSPAAQPSPQPERTPTPSPLKAPPDRAEEIPYEPAVVAAEPLTEVRTEADPRAAPPITTARLLDQAVRSEWNVDDTQPAPFARPVSSKLTDELRRPVLPRQANLFDDFVLPTEVEIVDRWLEPGGTHRVVVRTPTGHTLCGRQEPVDVFRPWNQMPMMFHLCAGGGRRTPP